jgi:glycosyltransferase involved in cell wall biosynthesis
MGTDDSSAADVCVILENLRCGGVQRVITTVAALLARSRCRVCIITLADDTEDFFELDPAVRRIIIHGPPISGGLWPRLLADGRRILSIRRAIRDSGSPVVMTTKPTMHLLVIFACLGLPVRVVIREPGPSSLPLDPQNLLRRRIYGCAAVVAANSRRAIRNLRPYIHPSKLVYLPNPLLMERQPQGGDSPARALLTVGRLHEQKGHDVLLRAFALVHREHPDWRLRLAGDGPLAGELRALAERLGIRAHVEWLGATRDTRACYAAADIFVLASRYEGTPNTLLEAMAAGRAVVVSDAGGSELVTHGENGLVTPVEDHAALAGALLTLIRDAGLRTRLGAAAARAVEPFRPEQALPVWKQILGLNAAGMRHRSADRPPSGQDA